MIGYTSRRTSDVSIHAPAQGATLTSALLTVLHGRFNPRPRAGGDFELSAG